MYVGNGLLTSCLVLGPESFGLVPGRDGVGGGRSLEAREAEDKGGKCRALPTPLGQSPVERKSRSVTSEVGSSRPFLGLRGTSTRRVRRGGDLGPLGCPVLLAHTSTSVRRGRSHVRTLTVRPGPGGRQGT